MDIGILLRGQSNAGYFNYYYAAEAVRTEVQRDLGFDGARDKVAIMAAFGKTLVSGAPFLCPPTECSAGLEPWMHGAPGPDWSAGTYETRLLDYVGAQRAAAAAPVILTLWLHNEADVYDGRLSAAEWVSAVRADARLARSAFRLDPMHSPYMFVWVPAAFGAVSRDMAYIHRSAQAIKSGMAALEQDPAFHALAGPQTGDLDMSNGAPGYGYVHMTRQDTASLVHRVANCVANALRRYARPGSVAAETVLDCHGPVAEQARLDAHHPGKVTVAFHLEPGTGIQPLGSAAAKGAGWVAVSPDAARVLPAQSAGLVGRDEVALSFAQPLSAAWRVYYGYGIGRIAVANGPGEGSALYDTRGIPMTMSWAGLPLNHGEHATPD